MKIWVRFGRLKAYLKQRASESSTWRGVVLVVTAFGARIDPTMQEAIVLLGLTLAGVIAIMFPD